MSYHLARLITAAETGEATTAERADIVRLILDLWVHRRDLPRHHGFDTFDDLRRTMAKLTDTSPWAHLHHHYLDRDDPDPVLTAIGHEPASSSSKTTTPETPEAAKTGQAAEAAVVADAGDHRRDPDGIGTAESVEICTPEPDDEPGNGPAPEAGLDAEATELLALVRNLDMTTREATLRLLWLAAEKSRDISSEWLDLADRIKETIESRTTTTLRRHAVLARRLRLNETGTTATTETDSGGDDDGGNDEQVEVEAVEWAEGVLAANPYDAATRADERADLLADTTLATELRQAAALLTTVAQALDDQATPEADRQ